jgi:hypothetical protein
VAGADIDFTSGSTTYPVGKRDPLLGMTDLTSEANLRKHAFSLVAGVAIPINR